MDNLDLGNKTIFFKKTKVVEIMKEHFDYSISYQTLRAYENEGIIETDYVEEWRPGVYVYLYSLEDIERIVGEIKEKSQVKTYIKR